MEAIISGKNNAKTLGIPHKGKVLFDLLKNIRKGSLFLTLPKGQKVHFTGVEEGLFVELKINDWKFVQYLLESGDIGLGESYQLGLWDCDEIEKLIMFGVQNQEYLGRVSKGSLLSIIYYRVKHLLNKNTKKGSQKNIEAHYDIGNEFYMHWLDKTMTYSSAYFINDNDTLEEAQIRKYNRILDQLEASPGQHILEIGCGWGGHIEQALKRGLKVTAVTLSKEQLTYCEEKFAGNEDVTLKLCDYRDLTGKYDHIVSIEMFEALGEEYWPTYFSQVHHLLKDDARAVIQTITIRNEDFKSYKKGSDFIQQYIFPGGMLPCPHEFEKIATKSGLLVLDEFSFGKSYSKTLNHWDRNYMGIKENLEPLGHDEKFHRLWHFYLKYCEGGFETGKINVYHYVLKKMN